MATYKKRLYGTRLDKAIEELDKSVYVTEVDGKKVNDINNNYPKNKTTRLLDEGYKAVKSNKSTTSSKKKKEEEKDTWFSKGAFSDGYQLGDITKSILGTTGDVLTGAARGIGSTLEGVGDLLTYGVAEVADLFGADEFADFTRKEASNDAMGEFFDPKEEYLDKYSVLGEKSDAISQGLGQVGLLIASGGVASSGSVATAITSGLTFTSSMGSGMSEAYQSGATDGEAAAYGAIKGAGDAVTELIFGGLGKGINAVGLSKGLSSADDLLAKKLSSKISNQVAKNITQWGIKAGAEGTEEVLAGIVSAAGKKLTYMSEEDMSKLLEDEQLLDQFIAGAVTSGVAQSGIVPGMKQGSLIESTKSGRDFVTGYTQNEQTVIDSMVDEYSNTIKKQNTLENELNKAIKEKETEQGGTLSDKEKNALREQINSKIESGELDISSTKVSNKEISAIREIVEEEMQKGLLDTNKIESILGSSFTENDSYLQRSYIETARKSENFTYDDAKVTNEQEKTVYDSAAKYFNNTTRSHEFVEKVAKIAKDKGTNYGFINNEELKSLGHDVEGKQVNGLVRTNQDGKQTVLINIDSPKALNTIVGHETTHLLEGTQEYKDLQEAIFNYAKEQGDYNGRLDSLNSLYEGIENANIDAELTADLVGNYLFTDEQFINSLSTKKPTVFQKIKELIDDLVVRFTGTKEEKALREVQKKFKEAYRKNAQSTEGTQYAVNEGKIQGLENYSTDEIKQLSKEYIQQKLEENDLYDVNIKDIAIHGSRNRGTARIDSDLDIVVEYEGDIREDDLFSALSEDPMFIDDIQVDINPITESLSDYMARSDAYDKEVLAKQDTKYSVSDYQEYTNALNATLEKAKKVDEQFYNNLKSQQEEYRERHQLEYDILKETDSRPATNENINSDFFKEHRSEYDEKRGIKTADGKLTVMHLQKGDNLAKLSFTEGEDKIWIDELYIKNQRQGYGSEIVNAIKKYAEANGKYVEAFKELSTAKGFWDKALRNSGVKYSLSEKGDLVVMHNLTESKLNGVLDLGGLPAPSIAISSEKTVSGNKNFGNYALLFDKNTIDPSNPKNKVFSRDAYTSRFPQVTYKLVDEGIEALAKVSGESPSSIESNIEGKTPSQAAEYLRRNTKVLNDFLNNNNLKVDDVYRNVGYNYTFSTDENVKKFVTDNDITFDKLLNDKELRNEFYELFRKSTPETLRNFTERKIETFEKSFAENNINIGSRLDSDFDAIKNGAKQEIDEIETRKEKLRVAKENGYDEYLEKLVAPAFGEKYLRNDKDEFTSSGRRRNFNQLYDEYNLENVVKALTRKGDSGSESAFMHGINEIAGNASIRFNSIDEIRNNKNLLQSIDEAEYKNKLAEIEYTLSGIQDSIMDRGHSNSDNRFMAYDNLGELIGDHARDFGNGKKVTAEAIQSDLKEYGFNPTIEEAQQILDIFSELRTLPTEYFEAKPQRAIGFDEVQVAIVPNDANESIKQKLTDNGIKFVEYDPNIEGDYEAKINQFDDLKFSLSQQNEDIAPMGDYNVYGEDVKLQQAIAPLQEEIKDLSSAITDLRENIAAIAPVQEVGDDLSQTEIEYTQPSKAELDNLMALQETGGTEYANTFFGLRDKYGQRKLYKGIREYSKAPDTYEAPIKGDDFAPTPQDIVEQQNEEAFNNIDESNMPTEMEDYIPDGEISDTKSLFETRDYEDVGSRKVNAYQYDNPEVKPYFQQEAKNMLGDLKRSVKGERLYNDDLYYESGGEQGYFGTQRQTTDDIAELLDGMGGKYKYTYADIEKGLNAIIKDEGSENNAVSKRIEFYLDQRLREGYTSIDGYEIPANQEYINVLKAREFDDFYNSLTIDDSMMPVENVDNFVDNVSNSNIAEKIAPAKEEYLAITPEKEPKLVRVKENPSYNEVAEILTEEPKTESDRNKRKWAIFKANVLDKGIVFEDLALKENNRELIAKWDYTLTSEARGQYAIGKGHNGSKSLDAIRQEVDNTGLTKDFYNYMYHKHNVDRMTLATRFEGMENKPVFGDSVTADVSQKIVNGYENQHPEFMDFAQDVYDYVNADKQLLVDNGVISQETADLWSEMYPHYVPTRRTTDTGMDINVPLDTMKTGINSPIKKATGGSADILPLFDTMAMRTLQTYRATAKNSFGVELLNTMGTTIESNQTNVDEVIDSIDAQDGLLQEGKKGKNPTFTVFDGGEKITFEITKDMYDALKPVSESSLLSKTIKPLNIAGNIRRGLLTEYNPTFMLTNAIKDVQDILLNSQHATKTYAKIPEAYKQIATKGYWYQEYVRNGGERNSYFDNETNTFKTENKGLKKVLDLPPLSTISKINNFIEMAPRLAEYIASRESGASIEVSMLDAARVSTNFKAGGAVTKFANRNGATFLNASVQGAMQQVRNIREAKANGVRGWVNLATKFAIAALPAVLLNNLVWEDDEEYEELSDYVKQNYYVIGKTDDGTFIRIPKGRAVAVIQEGINQMDNLITGDDEADLKSFIDLTINNLAPNNPLDNNILSPIVQVAQNKAWYGGDLVPTRLQDLPAAEQYDESTDEFSKWIGEIFNVSPYKVNYLLDQYSGGVGDVVLPMMTPEATSDAETIGEHLLAPFKSKFTTNSTMNNQNITDFYDTSEELTTNAKKSDATDNDVLSNKYMNSVKAEMNELYKEKREIQNSDLSKKEKYEQVLDIQSQINELAENALSEYSNVSSASNYSTVGDREYYKRINSEGETEWTKIDDDLADDLEDLGLTKSEKNTYFKTKDEISSIDEESETKKAEIIEAIKNTGFSDEQKAYMYKKYYNTDTVDTIVSSGINIDVYFDYTSKEFVADKDEDGKSISGSRKKKVINYINSLNLSIPEKAILIKATNTFKFNDYNYQIIDYVSGLDISYDEKKAILEELDMKVLDDGTVKWE